MSPPAGGAPDPLDIAVRRLVVTLRLNRPVSFPSFHGTVLYGLVTRALGLRKPFPRHLAVCCVEAFGVPRQSGQLYRFGLVGLGETGSRMLDPATEAIALRGRTVHRGGEGSLDGCYDLDSCNDLAPPDLRGLVAELASALPRLELRFRTPLFLPLPPRAGARLGYLNREQFALDVLLRASARRVSEVVGIDSFNWEAQVPSIPLTCVADASRMVNVNVQRHHDKASNPITGSVGLVRLNGLPREWLPYLAFGTMTQLGQGLGVGQGRYVTGVHGAPQPGWCSAASTALDLALAPDRIAAAICRVRDNTDVRHDGWILDEEVLDADVAYAVDAVRQGRYAASGLRGAFIPKRTGGERALAIPPPADRVLQRAVHEILDSYLDDLFEDSSYAYRKGRSVRRAGAAVRRALADGFGWVVDADITAFFDNVEWPVLGDLLDGVLAADEVTALILDWMRAPVTLHGRTHPRRRGLPQGSPLSPILANLYLDSLDEHLAACGFRVVRYADDFLVFCRDESAAHAAKSEAERVLSELGLSLNDAKTHVVEPGEGFRFLGLQFGCVEPTDSAPGTVSGGSTLPNGSWLEGVPLRDVRRATARLHATGRVHPISASGDGAAIGSVTQVVAEPIAAPRDDSEQRALGRSSQWLGERRPLIVVQRDAALSLSGEKIVVRKLDGTATELPVRGVSHVTLLGATRMTIPLVLRCIDLGVPVYFCRANGALRAAMAPPAEWPTIRRQLNRADDAAFCLEFGRAIVAAKLHNAATLLVRLGFAGAGARSAELRQLRDAAEMAGSIDQAMGYEGRGARVYFESWAETLGSEWQFAGRKQHPAPDPINALLSLAYTILYHHIGTALVSAGLDPRIGLLHRERGIHFALASDLQEELRFLGESVVWNLVSRRQIAPSDFADVGGASAIRMSDDARRLLARSVEERLRDEFTPPVGERQTYREFVDRQARNASGMFLRGASSYAPLRLKA